MGMKMLRLKLGGPVIQLSSHRQLPISPGMFR